MALFAKIATAGLLVAKCNAGNLTDITWVQQGDVNVTSTNTFTATTDSPTGGNYMYSSESNVVSFKIKPNFNGAQANFPDACGAGFVCGGSFVDQVNTEGFAIWFHSVAGLRYYPGAVKDSVQTVAADAEYELKIENNNVTIHTCTTGGACTGTLHEIDMGVKTATACMAKIQMHKSGCGFTVTEAVTVDVTTTEAITTTEAPDITSTAAPAAGTNGTNSTNANGTNANGTNADTATTAAPAGATASSGVASGASGLCVESTLIAASAVAVLTSIVV